MLLPLSEIVMRVKLIPYQRCAVIPYGHRTGGDRHKHGGVVNVLIQQGTEDALVSQTDGFAISRVAKNESVTWFLLSS